MNYLIPIWEEPRENRKILSEFEIVDNRELPLFVIFGFEEDEMYFCISSPKQSFIYGVKFDVSFERRWIAGENPFSAKNRQELKITVPISSVSYLFPQSVPQPGTRQTPPPPRPFSPRRFSLFANYSFWPSSLGFTPPLGRFLSKSNVAAKLPKPRKTHKGT